jgi:hypothetical protein
LQKHTFLWQKNVISGIQNTRGNDFCEKSFQKIWSCQKKAVILQPISRLAQTERDDR